MTSAEHHHDDSAETALRYAIAWIVGYGSASTALPTELRQHIMELADAASVHFDSAGLTWHGSRDV